MRILETAFWRHTCTANYHWCRQHKLADRSHAAGKMRVFVDTLILPAEAYRCWYACKTVIQQSSCRSSSRRLPQQQVAGGLTLAWLLVVVWAFVYLTLLSSCTWVGRQLYNANFLQSSKQKHTYSLLWLANFHNLEDFKTCVPTQLLPGVNSTGPLVASAASTQIISCMISTFFYLVHKNNITWHHSVLISLSKQCQQLQAL